MSRPQFRELPIDQVKDPAAPARGTDGFGDLDDLAVSIGQVGVIEPLIVARRDGYVEVVAGHRRLIAARMAGLVSVPCVVHDTFKAAEEAVMLHENVHRADLNPVDEARLFARVLDRVEGDVEKVAELMCSRRGRVESRLALLHGDHDVLAALERGDIPIGVAEELNLYEHHPTMLAHLAAAAAGGSKTAVVRQWRKQANEFHRLQVAAGGSPAPAPAADPTPAPANPFVCLYCGSDTEVHTMKQIYIHGSCLGLLRSALGVRSA